jgi:CRP/FNR family transcriptional regulator, cyclic AMP receptor protein
LSALEAPQRDRRVTRKTAPIAVRVLEADPDLGIGIPEAELQLASGAAMAAGFDFERGPWRFFPPPDRGGLGALVLSGMIVIRIDAGTRSHIELLGGGDVISPWVGAGEELAIPSIVNASALTNVRVALLDRRFALRTARWPEIHAALIQRLIIRSRRLSLQAAINAVSRVEERLELTLWELAYRFGRVTTDGIVLDLPITHSQLAEILAAQRPSVSTAVGRLQAHGRVVRIDRHRWLLPGEAPHTLSSLQRQSGVRS